MGATGQGSQGVFLLRLPLSGPGGWPKPTGKTKASAFQPQDQEAGGRGQGVEEEEAAPERDPGQPAHPPSCASWQDPETVPQTENWGKVTPVSRTSRWVAHTGQVQKHLKASESWTPLEHQSWEAFGTWSSWWPDIKEAESTVKDPGGKWWNSAVCLWWCLQDMMPALKIHQSIHHERVSLTLCKIWKIILKKKREKEKRFQLGTFNVHSLFYRNYSSIRGFPGD